MNYKRLNFLLLPLLIFSISCGSGDEKKTTNSDFLPTASLVPHELLVVMDSAQWNGLLGEAVRDVFAEPVAGLPQEEPQFIVRNIRPQDLRGFLKRYPNMLFAFSLDKKSPSSRIMQSMFSQNSLEQIKQDPKRFMITRKNEFAKGQEVMYLFSNTEDQLISKIYSNREQLLNHFLEHERKRSIREIAAVKTTRPIGEMLQQKYGFSMRFPAGYELAKQDSNFVWIRLLDNKVDKSIWATWKPYTSQDIFQKDSLMAFRNSVAKNYIWGSDPSTFMRLEKELPVVTKEVNFNGRYAIETRGLWRLEQMVMGGPFISYAFVDKASNRVYYIEGFTYAPGEKKRLAVNELEAILWTFRSPQQEKQ